MGANISIHAPHARSDDNDVWHCLPRLCISIHAPHARSDAHSFRHTHATMLIISIHAPHARSDSVTTSCRLYSLFQSTLLMRGATDRRHERVHAILFQSTLLMRGATNWDSAMMAQEKFQSTLLMRGATVSLPSSGCALIFQSTLLMRGATQAGQGQAVGAQISIHAPHARSDISISQLSSVTKISIHAPHARSDVHGMGPRAISY